MAQEAIDGWNADPAPDPNEHRHTYEHVETGTEKSLVCNEHHVPVEEAAEELDAIEDPDAWTWVLTEGHALDGGIAPTAIPCAECGSPIWGSRESAERNRGQGTARCGACVRGDE